MRTNANQPDELARLMAERDVLSTRIRELQIQKRAASSPFKIGDTIEWKHGAGRRRGVVVNFCGYDLAKPNTVVDPIQKNGKKGAPFVVRSWHQPTRVEAQS